MIRRFILRRYFSHIGKMGGQARRRQLRQPIIERTIQLRHELNLSDHPGLRA